jgi:GNAT superfamily N-acetyltransferase
MSTRSDFLIRRMELADTGFVKRLIRKTIDICYPGAYPKEAVDFFKEHHSDENIRRRLDEGSPVVLELDGQIVGTGNLIGEEIVAVFVAPAFQGQGFGKAIMQHLEGSGWANGLHGVKLHSSLVSKGFYDSLGYSTLREACIEVANGKRLDYYEMEKALAPPEFT